MSMRMSVRPFPPFLPFLPFRRRFLFRFRRLRRSRPRHREAHALPERIDLALHFMLSLDEILEHSLVPLQAGCRDELHPVTARGFVWRLSTAVPDGDVGIPRHEVRGLRVATRALDRLVDEDAVREIELEVL